MLKPAQQVAQAGDDRRSLDDACNRNPLWDDRDPSTLSPRMWLYGRHYLLGTVSATVADGGTGKTTLALTEAIAIATGRSLLCVEPWAEIFEGKRTRRHVLYWNGEEPHEEIDRRVFAICKQHGIPLDELGNDGTLEVLSGLDDYPITIARLERGQIVFDEHVVDELSNSIFDLIIIDPFVACHRVPENDNMAVDAVVKKWGEIASGVAGAQRRSIELVHHARKPMHGEQTDRRIADARGASAFIDGVRSARVLNKMSETEATRADIKGADRWRYIRADSGKANYAAPVESAAWYRLSSVILPSGDDVGVVTAWRFPGAFDNVTAAHMERVREMARTGTYRAHVLADDWIGRAVADVLDLDPQKDQARIKAILVGWYETGALKKVPRKGPDRHTCLYVEPGDFNGS